MITVQCKDGLLSYRGFLDVEKTLFCGQAFRWDKGYEGFHGFARCPETGKDMELCLVFVDMKHVRVFVTRAEFSAFWEDYFDLRSDYEWLHRYIKLSGDAFLKKCLDNAVGLRLLRQDFWETLCTFIISQRNNIPKIKSSVARLAGSFGAKGCFPAASDLVDIDPVNLRSLTGCGYRDEYLQDAARAMLDGRFDNIHSLSYVEQKELLKTVKGVGDKVADCTVLFGLHNRNAFPVDVWMQRIIDKEYGSVLPDFDPQYVGLIQQYMFYYALTHKKEFVA